MALLEYFVILRERYSPDVTDIKTEAGVGSADVRWRVRVYDGVGLIKSCLVSDKEDVDCAIGIDIQEGSP